MLPKAVLLDLDDTILNDSGNVDDCWRNACLECTVDLADIDVPVLLAAIDRVREWYWANPDRHREGRLDLRTARREIARLALAEIGGENGRDVGTEAGIAGIDDIALAHRIGDAYCAQREARMEPFPDAIATVRWLRESGCRLALLTNGGAAGQREKIARFSLGDLFDQILIEGELGFGKPDQRVFERALRELEVEPSDAWMVGDNLEWDVAPPQGLGMFAVWVDAQGKGIPQTSRVRPDRIVRTLSELREPPAC